MDDIIMLVNKINTYLNDPLYKNNPITNHIKEELKKNNINLNNIYELLTSSSKLHILYKLFQNMNENTNQTCDMCNEKIIKNGITLKCNHYSYHPYCYSLIDRCKICYAIIK